MKKCFLIYTVFYFLAFPVLSRSESLLFSGLAPLPDELFAPLRGDPRELNFAMKFAFPKPDLMAAEVAIGHYYGIYRWALPNASGAMQLNIGGGIFSLFNFSNNKDLQVVDYYGNVPLDIRLKKWSGRLMFYHVSSHLGDDYMRTSGQAAEKNSWNSLRSILSYDVNPALRLYGGYTYHFIVNPPEQKTRAYQSGFEVNFNIFGKSHTQAYWANDFQWWERTEWELMFNSQIGLKSSQKPKNMRGISYFIEYTTGPEYYGHFFSHKETRLTLGAKFDIT